MFIFDFSGGGLKVILKKSHKYLTYAPNADGIA